METGKRNLARLFIIQILLMVLLLSFVLTSEQTAPVWLSPETKGTSPVR